MFRQFEAHPSIRDDGDRFLLPKLSAFLFYGAAISLGALVIQIVLSYGARGSFLVPLLNSSIFAALFFWSRSSRPGRVAEATIIQTTATITLAMFFFPDIITWTIPFLIVPMLLSTIFLTYRATVILYAATVLFLLVYPQIAPPKAQTAYELCMLTFSVIGIVVLLQSWSQKSFEAYRLRQLIRNENRYRTLLREAYLGILVAQKGVFREVSAELSQRMGYEAEAIYNMPCDVLLPAIDFNSGSESGEFIFDTPTGEELQLEYISVKDTYEGSAATILAIRDVSERRRAEEAIAQAQRLDSLGLMAGGIAHDFNNLLTGVKGQATIAKMKMGDDNPAQKHIAKLLASTERAADLTRQLLAYAGKGNFESRVFDFNEFASDLIKLMRANLPTRISIELQLEKHPLPIEADPGQLQQILLNLVFNAAEAIETEKGHINVETLVTTLTPDEAGRPEMWSGNKLPAGDYIQCIIEDDGCGMEASTMKRIFDPFFTTKPSGTGLGLAATKGALQAHLGDLQLFSTPGVGTRFVIWLPLSPQANMLPKSFEASADYIQSINSTSTVLVIDDERNVRDTLKEMLLMAGFEVFCAENGEQGLALFESRRERIDLVIVDMMMPGLDGEETYHHLLEIDPSVRAIVCSGYSDSSAITRMTVDHKVAFISKPFEYERLIATVKQTLLAPVAA